jgi:HD-GYP domain-containing protein (c-di-GMP phosphodiesterase class II)
LILKQEENPMVKMFSTEYKKAIEEIRIHDHLVLISDSEGDRLSSVIPIIENQLSDGKRCVYISGSLSSDEIVDVFVNNGVDLSESLDTGQMTILVPRSWVAEESVNSIIKIVIGKLKNVLKQSSKKYRKGIVLIEEMHWLNNLNFPLDGILTYEAAQDRLLAEYRSFRLCQYDRQVFPPEVILEILKVHKLVIYQSDIFINPFFIPPEKIDPKQQAHKEVERMLQGLKDLKQWENELISTIKNLNYMVEINKAISGSVDLDQVVNETLNNIVSHLHPAAAGVMIYEHDAKILQYHSVRGFLRRYPIADVQIDLNRAFWQDLLFHYQTSVIRYKDNKFNGLPESIKAYEQENFNTYFAAPLVTEGEVKGLLEVYLQGTQDEVDSWRPFIDALVHQLAKAVGNAQAYEELQQKTFELTMAYDTTIARFAQAMDQRDNRISRNTQRLAEMTERLARSMNATEEDVVNIRRGVLLEDISKLSLLDKILQKQGPLTDKEWEFVHQHPQVVFNLLEDISILRPALEIPYCHHENWDGSGYPRGLAGEAIPLAARLFAVVNVYDALLTDRPYRPSWDENDALAYIQSLSGIQFDPDVVSAFFKMLDKDN